MPGAARIGRPHPEASSAGDTSLPARNPCNPDGGTPWLNPGHSRKHRKNSTNA
jgi:hypothetical protein